MLRADRHDETSGADQTGATPALTFGERGVLAKGAYLLCDDVPSNLTGWVVPLYDALITEIFIIMENAVVCSFDIQERVGAAFNTLFTITVSPAARISVQSINYAVNRLDELACRVSPTSATKPKSPKLGFIIKGDSA